MKDSTKRKINRIYKLWNSNYMKAAILSIISLCVPTVLFKLNLIQKYLSGN